VKAATWLLVKLSLWSLFQSTRPVKAATAAHVAWIARYVKFQSTRPVKAATDRGVLDSGVDRVSIHAAREGRDTTFVICMAQLVRFQSTRPVKAATFVIS
tara:strand:- start:1424 stop:1723 length:300 start_codon:yes stop_codon:yes gene_type:complete